MTNQREKYFAVKQKIEEKGLTEEQVRKIISTMLLFCEGAESFENYADFIGVDLSSLDAWYQIFRKK